MTDQPAEPPALSDWITIWHSEWAALATDREVQEAAQRAADLWAAHAAPLAAAVDAAARRTRPLSPPRTPAAADAPDARDAVIADLRDRVAELERRLPAPPPGP